MTSSGHLWAIGYDNMGRAEEVRDEITRLAWDTGQAGKYLILLDIAVVVRHGDGSIGRILGSAVLDESAAFSNRHGWSPRSAADERVGEPPPG